MENVCRLCLVTSTSDRMLLLSEGCEFTIMLSFCLAHHIQVTQDLPNKICQTCHDKVEDINLFREQIIQNEHILQNRLKDPISELPKVKDECEDDVVSKKADISEKKADDEKKYLDQTSDNIKNEINNFASMITHPNIKDEVEDEQLECNSNLEENVSEINELPEHINTSNSIEDNVVTCLTCFNKFTCRLDLLCHYQNVESKKNSMTDTKKKLKELKYKVITSNGNSLFKCEQCNKEYRNKMLIKRHFLTHLDRPFLCKLCGRTYRTALEILNHGKVHGGEVFVCSFKCGYSSVHKHVIKDHERRHRNEFKYTCETCGKKFQVKTWYLQHQNIHKGIKPYVCNICGMAFHLERYVTQHRNTVHPNVTTQKRYLCIHCSVPCGSKHGLALHLKEHDLHTSTSLMHSSVQSLCDECGKVLKNPRQLKCHKRTHMDPKPFVCGTCDKSFAKKSNLRVHEQSHSDVRYPCLACHRRFTQRSSLNRHSLRCREFVQKCVKCSKTYYNKKDYLKHNKVCL